ncbi:MAG: type II toxin-antitoxin system Phd/YefM family antitoxin [Sciscionella sp.]|nr:type II toxin-antitoxin system Phd/YefM family antitoxin [Sciscionella sp.]
MAETTWQVQEAKQRFSEVLRAAMNDGPQIVTKHGEEIAVVIDISFFRELTVETPNFKEFLTHGPDFDDLDLERSNDVPRKVELGVG